MGTILIRWLILAIAIFVAAHLKFVGIRYESLSSLLVAALVLGIINALLKPIFVTLTLPFILLTFGLFLIVINALLLYWTGKLVTGFIVPSFGSAIAGAVVISLVRLALEGWL
ncbi:phage holin family protein [Methylacidimicrobium sp. AP8]|uniref:phage holin family protein n=1 Tax=Methylacidimicrobium sp. AP8 TaxID=2730359 RepID=UPI0019225BBD|nr:phage holin family protein [Methylacidimicrobium sp. AP8]